MTDHPLHEAGSRVARPTAPGTVPPSPQLPTHPLAERIIAMLVRRGETVCTAESLTGGLVVARLIDVDGASRCVQGGFVTYALDLKHSVLGVGKRLLEDRGAVNAPAVEEMADGARHYGVATFGVATSGVAGPGPDQDVPAGTVWIAVASPAGVRAEQHTFEGERNVVRHAAVEAALEMLLSAISEFDADQARNES